MFCKNCGTEISENDHFCSNCGAEAKATPSAGESVSGSSNGFGESNYANSVNGNSYAYSSQSNGNYYGSNQNNGGYYNGNATDNGYQQGHWVPPVNDAPTVGEYLKWMLLYPLWNLVPVVGFIIYIVVCIKYALDNTYKVRANFFKAMLITQLIGIGIAFVTSIVMFVFMGTATAVGFSAFEELDPSFFMDEYYYSSMFIR